MAGQRLLQRGQDRGFGRSHIAHQGFGGKVVADLGGDSAHRANGHAQDDEFGIGDGGTGRVGHVVDQLQGAGRLAGFWVCIKAGKCNARHVRPHGACDRRPDQPKADDRNTRKGQHQASAPTILRSAAISPRVSSSVPMVMRRPLPRPCPGSQRTIKPWSIRP